MKFTIVLKGEKAWSGRPWTEITASNTLEADIKGKAIAAQHGQRSWTLLEGHNLKIDLEKYRF